MELSCIKFVKNISYLFQLYFCIIKVSNKTIILVLFLEKMAKEVKKKSVKLFISWGWINFELLFYLILKKEKNRF